MGSFHSKLFGRRTAHNLISFLLGFTTYPVILSAERAIGGENCLLPALPLVNSENIKKGMIGTEINRIRKEKQRLDCNEAQYEEKE